MLWTVFWTLLVSLVTLGGALLASPRGRRKLKSWRTKARQHRRRRSRAAWSAYRVRYHKTRRGTRRATRRAQPPRLTFGHVRAQSDPTIGTKAIRKARDRYQLARTQLRDRKAMESPKRTMGQRIRVLATQGPWAATKAEARHKVANARAGQCTEDRVDGYRCQNRVMIGDEGEPLEVCWVHRNRQPRGGLAGPSRAEQERRDAQRAREAEASRRLEARTRERYQAAKARTSGTRERRVASAAEIRAAEARGRRVATHGVMDDAYRRGRAKS